jgi:hypothetical protein
MIGVIDEEWAAKSLRGIVVREGVARTGLDLSLERAGVIWGRVTAGRGSKPMPGQAIILTERGPAVPPGTFKDQPPNALFDAFMRIADTDDDGRYAFRVAPGPYELAGPRVPGDQYAPIRLTVDAGREFERSFHLPRDDSPWKTIRGVVRANADDGPPIAGAVLVAQSIDVREPPAEGYADDRGRFELPGRSGKVMLYARSPAGDLAGHAIIGGDDERERPIIARPATTARGRVIDDKGQPCAGASVAYVIDDADEGQAGRPATGRDAPPGAVQSVLTDADGRFTALGLPIGATCEFRAFAPAGRDQAVRRIAVKDGQPIEVPPLILRRPPANPVR